MAEAKSRKGNAPSRNINKTSFTDIIMAKNKSKNFPIYKNRQLWIFIIIIIIILLLWLDRTYFGVILNRVSEQTSVSVEVVG